jgi:dipeptidyl aminopeptidase/acylaminoacyl peptidase
MKLAKSFIVSIAFMCSFTIATKAYANNNNLPTDRLTPELLWSMGRIGSTVLSPDKTNILYTVTTYNISENRGYSAIYILNSETKETKKLTVNTSKSESDANFIENGRKIVFLCADDNGTSQLWMMNTDGSNRKCISSEKTDVNGYLFSPDEKNVVLIHDVPTETSIIKNDDDLPKATGMVINELMYKHWDRYVRSVPHPFIANFDGSQVTNARDILDGQPYESPMCPFGGIEEFAWSPDSKSLAYVMRKKTGRDYAISTDSDIFLYNLETGKTKNLCKPENYKSPVVNATSSLKHQIQYNENEDYNLGYDDKPKFSPNGKYIAWTSMKHDGYESDRTRLCVFEFSTGSKTYVTETFDSGVNDFVWDDNSKELYFSGVWHGKTNLYKTNLKGGVSKITDEVCDYTLVDVDSRQNKLLTKKQSMSMADDIFFVDIEKGTSYQLTNINESIYNKLTFGEVKERWVKTVDGKQELCWVIYPPHFDKNKKYPTLLFCEGGPQSPVSQFWSYRWNFQIMAANDYIIIAPNRRGLPGFGYEWLTQISGDYTGLCMKDYLSAIDDICKEPYVDKDRLGCVGASFGGYSVYWLAGNHDKRFKCFIAHDGIFNTQQQYLETEEMWFPNWDMGSAPWVKPGGEMQKVYSESPHMFVDKWDTPILCIHGQKDFRIEYTQAESAFNAARLRGIPAQLLLFPDENHWVLKPQNAILWQRTFFRWLDKWLKN